MSYLKLKQIEIVKSTPKIINELYNNDNILTVQ